MQNLGSRHERLLESWADTIATQAKSEYFDFTSPTRSDVLEQKVNGFVDSPSEESFEELWDTNIIRDAVYGGSNAILNNWNETQADLATFIEDIRDADAYDPAWERRFPEYVAPAIRELYGRLLPHERPIFNRSAQRGLSTYGFGSPSTVNEGLAPFEKFQDTYLQHVGHVTEGTSYEVPLSDEIEQFFYVTTTQSETELRSLLDMDSPTYATFSGWDAINSNNGPIQLSGLTSVLDAFSKGSNSEAYNRDASPENWGDNHWETWKDEYCRHLQEEVFPEYDPATLSATQVEPFLEELSIEYAISNVVPIYLLGGRWQPWDSFKKTSVADPERAAEVLSSLLDEDGGPLIDRLNEFNDFYAGISDSGSERMSVATLLLMITHPEKHIMYRYTMFKDFFSEFSPYEIPNGYNPGDYLLMSEALQGVRADLDETTTHDVRMLDVHSLLWMIHREGLPNRSDN
jgi:hypothetical protein